MFKCSNVHRNHRLLEEVETLCAPDADGETVALEFQDRFEALSEPNADYIAKHTCALLLLLSLSLSLLLLLLFFVGAVPVLRLVLPPLSTRACVFCVSI